MKKTIMLLCVSVLLMLSACGAKENDTRQEAGAESVSNGAPEGSASGAGAVLTVIASPGAHTAILKQAAYTLSMEGIELVIDSDFDDYMIPNWFVDGEVYDCNYFQHEAYMEAFNEEQDTDLVSAGKIHFEPLGIYPANKTSLSAIANGDVITVPRDTTNQARALQLLNDAGIITIDPARKNAARLSDIIDNPKGVRIELMDASQVPAAVAESAFVVMNGNYARQALYTVTEDALAYENPDAEAAERYANIIAVKNGNQDNPLVRRLVEVLQSDQIQNYIDRSYSGALVAYRR